MHICTGRITDDDVADPSPDVVDVLIQCMDWNMASRQSRIPEDELPELHEKAVALLDLLKQKLPDKTGEKSGWNFEKTHSILHKVREIVMWGNSDNTSCQAPEVCTNVSVHSTYMHVLCTYINIVNTYMFILLIYMYRYVYRMHVYTCIKYIHVYMLYIHIYTCQY